jgi:hypothetical protein
MLTFSPLSIFNELAFTPREKVYVVSDTQYATYQKAEAEKQIAALQLRADEYTKALATITSTIDGLKQEHGITEPPAVGP